MLKIKNLHAKVEGLKILKGIDLEINPGEVHAIMGPNGSGKSTFLRSLPERKNMKLPGERSFLKGKNLQSLLLKKELTKVFSFLFNIRWKFQVLP